jgi:hypothetical protein
MWNILVVFYRVWFISAFYLIVLVYAKYVLDFLFIFCSILYITFKSAGRLNIYRYVMGEAHAVS